MNLNIYNNESKYISGLKTGTREEHLVTQLWRVISRRIVKCISPINPVNGKLLVRPRLYAVPRERNMDLKSMQVNVSKSLWFSIHEKSRGTE